MPPTTCTSQTLLNINIWPKQTNWLINLTKNRPADFWLTKGGSECTNRLISPDSWKHYDLIDKRPLTSWLFWLIRSTTRDIYIIHLLTIHKLLDSDDVPCSGCQNFSESHLKQSIDPSQDLKQSHPDDHNLVNKYIYNWHVHLILFLLIIWFMAECSELPTVICNLVFSFTKL